MWGSAIRHGGTRGSAIRDDGTRGSGTRRGARPGGATLGDGRQGASLASGRPGGATVGGGRWLGAKGRNVGAERSPEELLNGPGRCGAVAGNALKS